MTILHKMRVACSACADWPISLQKHKQRATRNNPGVIPHAGAGVLLLCCCPTACLVQSSR